MNLGKVEVGVLRSSWLLTGRPVEAGKCDKKGQRCPLARKKLTRADIDTIQSLRRTRAAGGMEDLFPGQLVPEPVTVIAYRVLPLVVPFALTSRWPAVMMNVMLEGPNARSESITAVPVETCFWPVLSVATPGVL